MKAQPDARRKQPPTRPHQHTQDCPANCKKHLVLQYAEPVQEDDQ